MTMTESDVGLWFADLDALWAAQGEALRGTLSDDELERAAGFRFERDRQRFVSRRALLRALLAGSCGTEAADLRFDYGSWGKPRLQQDPQLGFSTSHARGLAAVAIARGADIGIDVERIRDDVDVDGLARRYFAPAEVDALAAVPDAARTRAFFACWTRKEAFVKAIGRGLSYPLDSFAVSFANGDEPRITVDDPPDESERWALHALDPGPGYVGALAVSGGRHVGAARWLEPADLPA